MFKFIPILFFDAIINGIVFLSYFSDGSFLYKNATDFCLLIFNFATLLNLFIIVNIFGGVYRVFTYKVMLSANRKFYLFLLYLEAFHFFQLFPLIALFRTYSTMMNRSDKSESLVLFLILEEKFLPFHF